MSMTEQERLDLIEVLTVMTGKNEGFYQNMNSNRLTEEYDRLMESCK
jgi:hypothetical protein